jgi:hypothetical protein
MQVAVPPFLLTTRPPVRARRQLLTDLVFSTEAVNAGGDRHTPMRANAPSGGPHLRQSFWTRDTIFSLSRLYCPCFWRLGKHFPVRVG